MNALDQVTVQLTRYSCGECGVVFALDRDFVAARKESHATWYCPNGHPRYFPEKSDAEKAQAEADRYRRSAEFWQEQSKRRGEEAARAEASRRVTKGHLTRLRKRVAGGACPCCQRNFQNLARHMANQHPDFGKEG